MPNQIEDVGLKINVRQTDGSPFTQAVDIDFQHQVLSDHRELRGIDASKTIEVTGLHRAPVGLHKVTVTPIAEFKPQAQFVNIPASGFATVEFAFGRVSSVDYIVKGVVRYSNGQPAAGVTVRAYDLDLRSKQLLGKASTSKPGKYKTAYTPQSFARAEKNTADLFVRVS